MENTLGLLLNGNVFVNLEAIYRFSMTNIQLSDNRRHSLAFYLAMEEYVASRFEGEAFFVWRVAPTVIFGRNQILENEVNVGYCKDHDVKVVRRRSGGGCVYSDLGNIMISYVSRRGDVAEVFERYMSAMADCLRSLGIDAVKSGRNDILVGDRKISGNAFHQTPDRSVVHGTLLYDTDMDALETAIRPPVEKLERHGVMSVRQRVRNIADIVSSMENPHESLTSVEALEKYIVGYFTDEEKCLTEDDMDIIEKMSETYRVDL